MAGAELVVDGWSLGRSASDGSFLVRHAPRDWTTLLARTETRSGTASPRAGRVVVRVEPLRRVSGAVRDRRSQRPLAGAVVSLGSEQHSAFSVTTDATGRYALAVPEGRYVATVRLV